MLTISFTFFYIVITIIIFVFSSLILFGLIKLFKLQNATYKKTIKILLFFSIISILINAFLEILQLNFNSMLFCIYGIIIFLIFHYFFKKYYQISWKKSLIIYIAFCIVILVAIIPFRYFLIEPFIIRGNSMNPTLIEEDYLLIEKFSNNYKRNDIIIFKHLENNKIKFLIKRIIGLPNEKIEIINNNILINDKILQELNHSQGIIYEKINLKLDNNEYFVLGDNREKDLNLHSDYLVNKQNIIGKVFLKVIK